VLYFIAILLTCQQAQNIISKMKPSLENRDEIIQMIKDSSGECGELLPESKESIKFIDTKPNSC
jgi:hypothetical protein